ncbi:MAG: GspE/PulE family protein [Victivallaceae bacterium]|nr:GspE/PulE family protein [Victivallaceae bacterium]
MNELAAITGRDLAGLPEKLSRLAAALKAKFDDYPENGTAEEKREFDSSLTESGQITEVELTALYRSALNLAETDENDFSVPSPRPELSADFLAANAVLPAETLPDGTVLCYAADPYGLPGKSRALRDALAAEPAFKLLRRTFLERQIAKVCQNGDDDESPSDADAAGESELRQLAGEARIVRLVNDIFTRALEMNASDIHIEPGGDAVSVRCRVDGVLTEILTCPLQQFPAISSRIKLIADLNIAESRLPQDGRTGFRLGRTELDMRVSTIPILTGESIVLRLLNKESVAFDLASLGMSSGLLAEFDRLIRIPHGIILVVGPTGSGKTTTLYSVISKLNDNRRKIITIEDPVEYQLPGLSQMQVNSQIGVTFAAGLRHIVRQDPDIILVGEIRDRETADIAINAALTGHLVLSTLHTNDAVGAVTRLADMGVEPFLISSALFGVLSQRLVRKLCTECGGSGSVDGARCRRCNGAGFKGRMGIFELLTVNERLRHAITANLPSDELEKIAEASGMVPLAQDGLAKVKSGVTTIEELRRSTADI